MLERGVSCRDVFDVLRSGEEIQDYPEDTPFPSALFLGWQGRDPLHVVVALDSSSPQTYIITTNRPDLDHFEGDFKTRKTR